MVRALFDTLQFAKRLKVAGVSSAHAEAETEALADVLALHEQELATKKELRDEMSKLSKDMTIKLSDFKSDLIKWVSGLAFGQITLMIGALAFFTAQLPT